MTMRIPRLAEPGETIVGSGFSVSPGGKGSNQAVAARRLGAEVDLLTCIGPDELGRGAQELWTREGVGHEDVKVGTLPTMVGIILVEPGGENRIAIAPGALDELRPDDVLGFAARVAAADLCMVGLEIPVETAVAALQLARRVGTATLLNPAPARPLPDAAWDLIDYLTPNRLEAGGLLEIAAHTLAPAALLDGLRRRCPGAIALTLGADGVLVAAAGTDLVQSIPAAAVSRVVDTTGAGDAFNGALAVALADGAPLAAAAAFANRAGAHAVQHADVIPSLPYRGDLP